MERRICISLPVANLVASQAFYAALGAEQDERFCDGSTAMMRLSDAIGVMLVEQKRFQRFTPRQVTDARTHSEVLLCLWCADRGEVDRLSRIAGWAGGRADPKPAQDHGFRYGRSFEDPDGHIWEAVWVAEAAAVPALKQMQPA
jgi:predicted lactoylglutathione lyase